MSQDTITFLATVGLMTLFLMAVYVIGFLSLLIYAQFEMHHQYKELEKKNEQRRVANLKRIEEMKKELGKEDK